MTRADNTAHLLAAAATRHHDAIRRARNAITHLDHDRKVINFTTVATAAGVSRSWLYHQAEIRDTIIAQRHTQTPTTVATPAAERATIESLRQRLDTARDDITRLRAENTALRDQLARNLGEQRTRH